jgi:hypothetical protein
MNNLQTKVKQVINEINEITDLLYQQKLQEGYVILNRSLGNIMIIMEDIYQLRQIRELPFDDNSMIDKLKSAMEAMEKKDSVLLADILIYEIAEQFNEVVNLLDD